VHKRICSSLTVGGVVSATLYVVACSGGGTGNKIMLQPDSSSADATAACTAQSSYTGISFGSNQNAESDGSGTTGADAHADLYLGQLPSPPTNVNPDLLDIELYAGTATFGSGDVATGTYNLTNETQYSTCGACVMVWPQATVDGSGNVTPVDQYLATSGSITLTSVGPAGTGMLTGTVSNVAFQHVTIDPNSFMSTPDGNCTSMIGSASFSATLTQGSNAAPAPGSSTSRAPIHLLLRTPR